MSCQLSSFCYIRAPVEVFILQRERAVTWLYSLYAVRTSYAVFTEVTVQEKVALYYRLFRKTELLAENPSGFMNSGLKIIFVFLFYRVILIYSSYFDILELFWYIWVISIYSNYFDIFESFWYIQVILVYSSYFDIFELFWYIRVILIYLNYFDIFELFWYFWVIFIYSSYFDILYSTSSGRPLLRGANGQRQDQNFRT